MFGPDLPSPFWINFVFLLLFSGRAFPPSSVLPGREVHGVGSPPVLMNLCHRLSWAQWDLVCIQLPMSWIGNRLLQFRTPSSSTFDSKSDRDGYISPNSIAHMKKDGLNMNIDPEGRKIHPFLMQYHKPNAGKEKHSKKGRNY